MSGNATYQELHSRIGQSLASAAFRPRSNAEISALTPIELLLREHLNPHILTRTHQAFPLALTSSRLLATMFPDESFHHFRDIEHFALSIRLRVLNLRHGRSRLI